MKPLLFLAFCSTVVSTAAVAQTPNVIPGKSLGKIRIGDTPAQVHKSLGKPTATVRFKSGIIDDVYKSKQTRKNWRDEIVRDKVEVLYRAGRVIQIEATSPIFKTGNGISTNSTTDTIQNSSFNWRYFIYTYIGPEDSAANYFYFTDLKQGLTIEFEGWQENLFRRSKPTTIIVHRPKTRVIPDAGGVLTTESTDSSVVMSEFDND